MLWASRASKHWFRQASVIWETMSSRRVAIHWANGPCEGGECRNGGEYSAACEERREIQLRVVLYLFFNVQNCIIIISHECTLLLRLRLEGEVHQLRLTFSDMQARWPDGDVQVIYVAVQIVADEVVLQRLRLRRLQCLRRKWGRKPVCIRDCRGRGSYCWQMFT